LFDGVVCSHARYTAIHPTSYAIYIPNDSTCEPDWPRDCFLILVVTASLAAAYGGGSDGYHGPTDPGPGGAGAPSPTATVMATPAIQFTPATVELAAGGAVTFEVGATSGI